MILVVLVRKSTLSIHIFTVPGIDPVSHMRCLSQKSYPQKKWTTCDQISPPVAPEREFCPHFYFRFTDSETNNLGLYLPLPDKARESPDWLADHVKRHMNVGLICVDYTSLLAALSQQIMVAPSREATATMLFRLFLADPDTKGWLYHPRERAIRERLREVLKERFLSSRLAPPTLVNNQLEMQPPPVVIESGTQTENLATPETLLSIFQITEMIVHEGQDEADAVLYSPDCQLEIEGGWLVLKHDKLWLVERSSSGGWSKRTTRFAGGMRSGRYVPANDVLVRSIKAAVGYGNRKA